MVLNWILSLTDAFLLMLLLRKPEINVKIDDDITNTNDIDLETGMKMPILKDKQEYYDPITGVRVESYREDFDDE